MFEFVISLFIMAFLIFVMYLGAKKKDKPEDNPCGNDNITRKFYDLM